MKQSYDYCVERKNKSPQSKRKPHFCMRDMHEQTCECENRSCAFGIKKDE